MKSQLVPYLGPVKIFLGKQAGDSLVLPPDANPTSVIRYPEDWNVDPKLCTQVISAHDMDNYWAKVKVLRIKVTVTTPDGLPCNHSGECRRSCSRRAKKCALQKLA